MGRLVIGGGIHAANGQGLITIRALRRGALFSAWTFADDDCASVLLLLGPVIVIGTLVARVLMWASTTLRLRLPVLADQLKAIDHAFVTLGRLDRRLGPALRS